MFFFSLITLNNGQDLTITVTDFFLVSYLSLIGKRGCEGSLIQKCLGQTHRHVLKDHI